MFYHPGTADSVLLNISFIPVARVNGQIKSDIFADNLFINGTFGKYVDKIY